MSNQSLGAPLERRACVLRSIEICIAGAMQIAAEAAARGDIGYDEAERIGSELEAQLELIQFRREAF